MLQKLILYKKNLTNGYNDDVSMLSLEKQNTDTLEGIYLYYYIFKIKYLNYIFLVDCDLSSEDNHLTNPEDMCIAIGSGSGDQSEDSSITDSERQSFL